MTNTQKPSGVPSSIEIIARGLLYSGGSVLLCRNKDSGYSYLPGGHVEVGETAAAALLRELQEEARIEAHAGDLLLVSENLFQQKGKPRQEITLVFLVEHTLHHEASVASAEEHIEFHWAELASISDLDLRPASAKAWLLTLGSDQQAATAVWTSESYN